MDNGPERLLFRGQGQTGEIRNNENRPGNSENRPDEGAGGRPAAAATRSTLGVLALALTAAFVCATATGLAGATPTASVARSLMANDEGRLHLVGESGADLIEEGKVMGTLPGRVRVQFDLSTAVTASFVLYPNSGGSISGHGSGRLHSAGRYASFGGSMLVSGGTGRYRRASGTGGLYGTLLREGSYPVVVQTRGTLRY